MEAETDYKPNREKDLINLNLYDRSILKSIKKNFFNTCEYTLPVMSYKLNEGLFEVVLISGVFRTIRRLEDYKEKRSISEEYEILRFRIKHSGLVPLLGWGKGRNIDPSSTKACSIFFVYMYYDTSLEFYKLIKELGQERVEEYCTSVINTVQLLNKNKMHIASDSVYIGEEENIVIGDELSYDFVDYKTLPELGMSEVSKEKQLKASIVFNFVKNTAQEIKCIKNIFQKFKGSDPETNEWLDNSCSSLERNYHASLETYSKIIPSDYFGVKESTKPIDPVQWILNNEASLPIIQQLSNNIQTALSTFSSLFLTSY